MKSTQAVNQFDLANGEQPNRRAALAGTFAAILGVGIVAAACSDLSPTHFTTIVAYSDPICDRSEVECAGLTTAERQAVQTVIFEISNPDPHCQSAKDSLQAYLNSNRIVSYKVGSMGDTTGWTDPENWTIGIEKPAFDAIQFGEMIFHEADHANRHGHTGQLGWATTHPTATFNNFCGACLDQ